MVLLGTNIKFSVPNYEASIDTLALEVTTRSLKWSTSTRRKRGGIGLADAATRERSCSMNFNKLFLFPCRE
jgi:hypothetical protein